MVRQRRTGAPDAPASRSSPESKMPAGGVRMQWIVYAVASGACAAFNGVFAKLTTTDLTSSLAAKIADILNLSSMQNVVEYVVRAIFFTLNLTFNGVMWALFTTALARGTSTTQVSIMNTSTNFMLTAILGLAIFGESLPPMWWVGAALLVAGNVIVGRKDESKSAQTGEGYEAVPGEDDALRRSKDSEDEDVIDLRGEQDDRSR